MGWSEPKKFGVEKFDLGTGTSFNIPELIEDGTLPATIDYTKLTEDNFITGIRTVNSLSTGYGPADTSQTMVSASSLTVAHSYNVNTGTLTISKGASRTLTLKTNLGAKTTATEKFTPFAYLVC